jgi:hypothetical protein
VKTRKAKPTGPEGSPWEHEQLAWLVVEIETGAVVGKITRVIEHPGYWQAYAIEEAPFDAPPKEPVRLGFWELCRDAQDRIEQWHTERETAWRTEALREIQEGR